MVRVTWCWQGGDDDPLLDELAHRWYIVRQLESRRFRGLFSPFSVPDVSLSWLCTNTATATGDALVPHSLLGF